VAKTDTYNTHRYSKNLPVTHPSPNTTHQQNLLPILDTFDFYVMEKEMNIYY